MTSAIQNTPAAGAAAPRAPQPPLGADEHEDRFLRLLVAQLRNQDPLNPLDNAQVTAQMAQIATVRGIERLNETLGAIAAGAREAQSLQAALLVGREVLVAGDAIALGPEGARAGYELAADADRVVVTILDGAGRAVHRVDLGPQPAGVHALVWDGADDRGVRLADGTYRLAVAAERAGAAVEASALAAVRVAGAGRDAAGVALDLAGVGRRPYSAVKLIL
ncbi:MAG: flagellar hook assembly protein FlgD [Burkholderiales bacterium]|nr:flagellar hook assembly protein FlgD [Burkholderiales bacterium]